MEIRVNHNQMEEIEGIRVAYPYVMHVLDVKLLPIPWHWHEEVEFVYVNSGELLVTTLNQTYQFLQNEAFFINTNVLCSMKGIGKEPQTVVTSHLFHEIFLGGHYKSIFQTKYMHPVLQNKNIDILIFRRIHRRQHTILTKLKAVSSIQADAPCEFQVRNLFSDIWLLLLEEIADLEEARIPVTPVHQERIQQMLSYIHQHYSEKVLLEDIAASAAISKRECSRCFQSSIQKTPGEYLLEYRIEKAAQFLADSEDTIMDISLQTGFSNPAYFGKIFKQLRGVTPGMYRKAHRCKDKTAEHCRVRGGIL